VFNRLTITDLPLSGLKLVKRQRRGDARGFLSRLFCIEELSRAGWNKPIAQINLSYTARCGTVRGMHFQRAPHAEMKLVSCIHGEVWDVTVDVRPDSKSFLQWHAECLSAGDGCALFIPEGFAHGFQALSNDVELLYCHSAAYVPAAEAGLNPKDPLLAITWPLHISEISARDAQHPLVKKGLAGREL
jgi:dTDP-4-dehydrorhamnose 3,5-epimerase